MAAFAALTTLSLVSALLVSNVADGSTRPVTAKPAAVGVPAVTVPGLGPLSHYLCYNAVSVNAATTGLTSFPQKPKAAWLQNQFASLLGTVGALQKHCNPADKILPDGSVTLRNLPNDHLACWAFDGNANTPPPTVNVTNQFSPTNAAGTPMPVPLQIVGLRSLCLPSWKSLTVANLPPGAPGDLDHYSCYAVKYPAAVAGTVPVRFLPPNPPKQGGVTLQDQFTDMLGTPLKVVISAPQTLCLPTIKIINPDPAVAPPTVNNLIDPVDHLLCFGLRVLSPVPFSTPASVFDRNQFGTGQVGIKTPSQLCVPSLKNIPGTPGA
jgi:hypothetical protein